MYVPPIMKSVPGIGLIYDTFAALSYIYECTIRFLLVVNHTEYRRAMKRRRIANTAGS